MRKKIILLASAVVFVFLCLIAFNKKTWAASIWQTGNTDTSITINWEGTDTDTNYGIAWVEIPAGIDYSKESALKDSAEAKAESRSTPVNKGTYSYTISNLKPQAEYYVCVAHTSYDYNYSYGISAFTKIKKVNNVAQKKWWKYIEDVEVTWDPIPATYSSNVKYEVMFMNASGKKIEKKTLSYNDYSHSVKNNKIYTIKVRATRTPDSYYTKGMATETTAWSDVEYLFTQPTITKSKLTNSKLTIKWGKIPGVTSYDIYVSTKKNKGYKKVKTVKASKTSATITKYNKKKLSKWKKKKYFVYIVPNKKVNGKVVKKDVTYTYKIQKGTNRFSEGYK